MLTAYIVKSVLTKGLLDAWFATATITIRKLVSLRQEFLNISVIQQKFGKLNNLRKEESKEKTMRKVHGARIELDFKILLKILDFEGGTIHRVYTPDEYLYPDKALVIIEHPDLPEIPINEVAQTIRPIYQSTYGDNGCLLRAERIEPAKVSKN